MIVELAGQAGIENYDRMTWRELYSWVKARIRDRWDRASFIAAYSFNSNPYLKKSISPGQINPLRDPHEKQVQKRVSLKEIAGIVDQ